MERDDEASVVLCRKDGHFFSCFEGACSDQKCSRWNGYCSRSFEASKNSTRRRKRTGSTVLIIKNKKKGKHPNSKGDQRLKSRATRVSTGWGLIVMPVTFGRDWSF